MGVEFVTIDGWLETNDLMQFSSSIKEYVDTYWELADLSEKDIDNIIEESGVKKIAAPKEMDDQYFGVGVGVTGSRGRGVAGSLL